VWDFSDAVVQPQTMSAGFNVGGSIGALIAVVLIAFSFTSVAIMYCIKCIDDEIAPWKAWIPILRYTSLCKAVGIGAGTRITYASSYIVVLAGAVLIGLNITTYMSNMMLAALMGVTPPGLFPIVIGVILAVVGLLIIALIGVESSARAQAQVGEQLYIFTILRFLIPFVATGILLAHALKTYKMIR
jgi:hypothetical protein